ncbi:aminopeptidase P family N-terminal domain-containing protein [Virgibacillus pantothenticus]|uniref:aminopeptidase P family N-terminal domain-containing protein n=1 Tax=Virgibacillus pantothenticus TaxID=1473 RepID=UPI002014F1D2|nr:aminopeptidase P family N-terminal domain-containing protein [Virgibacillus pantothenticus]
MYNQRLNSLREDFSNLEVDSAIIFNFENQFYFTGLKAITYSRPIILGIDEEKTHFIIPSLEEQHAKAKTNVDNYYIYHETKMYSKNNENYLDYFSQLLQQFPAHARIGI